MVTYPSTTCREATLVDVDAIAACANAAFVADAFFKKQAFAQRFTREDIQAMLSQDHSAFLVVNAKVDDQVATQLAGCIHVEYDAHTGMGHFGSVSVPKEFERQGLGSALVQAAELWLAAKHSAGLWVEICVVNVRHELFSFYERKGYRRTGRLNQDPGFAMILNDAYKHVHTEYMVKYIQLPAVAA
ncbi:Aste57867_10033 [Aphanomyces stellatus]|uniref:Aste57867_10033 protein n=1 Tax=Aphanomyces stellatus TaxID=120398 RepID=A0A485KPN8_9STRA|nr:hypothetical protein As57867_009994 [Aphanomyces stellatus]VFT86910.1 Aste57867_10033 [Aphanomyces stellatus]